MAKNNVLRLVGGTAFGRNRAKLLKYKHKHPRVDPRKNAFKFPGKNGPYPKPPPTHQPPPSGRRFDPGS